MALAIVAQTVLAVGFATGTANLTQLEPLSEPVVDIKTLPVVPAAWPCSKKYPPMQPKTSTKAASCALENCIFDSPFSLSKRVFPFG
jgi:hypothetical protein